jgi:uncharacterized membrane protein YGL010W
MGIWDLESQLAFYGSYHNNKWNRLIHIIFVPVILWSALLMTTALPPLFVPAYSSLLTVNLALFVALFYGAYYVLLERHWASLIMFVLLVGMWLLANYIHELYPTEYLRLGVLLHLLGWISQFAGHKFAEGRQPALFDNLFQSLVLAPLFVWMEVLFMLFNYRPTLHKKVQKRVEKNIEEWRKSKGNSKLSTKVNAKPNANHSPSPKTKAKPRAKK